MTNGPDRDAESAAEERLVTYLEGLREDPPQPTDELVGAIVSAARWQGAVRPYLDAAGALWAAMAVGAAVLAGGRRRP